MDIYLDQNKWIEIARIYHGKDASHESKKLLNLIQEKVELGLIRLPLSAVHYIETASISNQGRKERLGTVMSNLSKGVTLASYNSIVIHELENALSAFFDITPRDFELFGYGYSHAFDIPFPESIPESFRPLLERACLTGEKLLGHTMAGYDGSKQSLQFRDHLRKIHMIKKKMPRDEWSDALHALALTDIAGPLSFVIEYWGIEFDAVISLGKDNLSSILMSMPSRALEVHLHNQVLKNPTYNPKFTDLEDWGGFALGAQYCDYAVGEKHMVDMLLREKFQSKSKVYRSLTDLIAAL